MFSAYGLDRDDLGVRTTDGSRRAPTEDSIGSEYDGADAGIGIDATLTARGGSKRETKHTLVSARRPGGGRGTTHLRVPRDRTGRSPCASFDCPPGDNSEKKAS